MYRATPRGHDKSLSHYSGLKKTNGCGERATEEGRERTYLAWKRRGDEKTRTMEMVSHSVQTYQIYVKVEADLVNLSRKKNHLSALQ